MTFPLIIVLAFAAVIGCEWYLSLARARSERAWRAALDRFADKEMAKNASKPNDA